MVTVLGLALIWIAAFVLGGHTWGWVTPVFGGLATFIFFHQAFRKKIQADPPHQGILVFLGRRQKKLLREGLIYLPFRPVIFDALQVNVVKVNQDLPELILRTPDKAEIYVSVSMTWTPGLTTEGVPDEERAEALIHFLNSGEEKGVRTILQDIISDRLRIWAFSDEEGPADWEEAVGAKDDTVAILVKAILGEVLAPIHSTIPTSVLLRYFSSPRLGPTKYETKRYGRKDEQDKNASEWEKLEEELGGPSSTEYQELKGQVEERRKIIQKLRQGDGYFYKKSLGITLNKFTVNAVKPHGETAKAVDAIAKETYQREAEAIEIKNVLERVQEIMDRLHVSAEEAIEVVQTERKKVVKSIQEGKLNIAPETRVMLENFFPGLLAAISQSRKRE